MLFESCATFLGRFTLHLVGGGEVINKVLPDHEDLISI